MSGAPGLTRCWGCGGVARPYHRRHGLCDACSQYRQRHGTLRPIALIAVVLSTCCRHCTRPVGATERRHDLCVACDTYARRHDGALRPLDRLRGNAWAACTACGHRGPRRQGLCAACRAARGPGVGWVALPHGEWAPPAGYCKPGESYGQVAGCARCGHRVECAALSRTAVAS